MPRVKILLLMAQNGYFVLHTVWVSQITTLHTVRYKSSKYRREVSGQTILGGGPPLSDDDIITTHITILGLESGLRAVNWI